MNTYSITYRKTNGNTDTAKVKADSEAQARNKFSAQYDGRIITVDEG